ncbi:MAG: T9SS type A sorting domain-containing protein [Bacteroidia bacterium]|nr:T9SS type A sorting domain-containing protein [Bacteroidia bacterium]
MTLLDAVELSGKDMGVIGYSPYYPTTAPTSGIVSRIDSSGNWIWYLRLKHVNFNSKLKLASSLALPAKSMLVGGNINGLTSTQEDAYLAKIDSNGNRTWSLAIDHHPTTGGSWLDYCKGARVLNNGNYLLGGYSTNGTQSRLISGTVSPNGNFIHGKSYYFMDGADTLDFQTESVRPDLENGLLIAGQFRFPGNKTATGIIHLDSLGNPDLSYHLDTAAFSLPYGFLPTYPLMIRAFPGGGHLVGGTGAYYSLPSYGMFCYKSHESGQFLCHGKKVTPHLADSSFVGYVPQDTMLTVFPAGGLGPITGVPFIGTEIMDCHYGECIVKAEIGYNQSNLCIGDTLFCADSSKNSTQNIWLLNGTVQSTNSPYFSMVLGNSYSDTITLIVSDSGCSDTTFLAVNSLYSQQSGYSLTTQPAKICNPGDTVTLIATGLNNTIWNGPGVSNLPGNSISVSIPGPGTYFATGTDSTTCQVTGSVYIGMHVPYPHYVWANPDTACLGANVNLYANGLPSHYWNGPGLSNAVGSPVTVQVNVPSTFFVHGLDYNLCPHDDSVHIPVFPVLFQGATISQDSVCKGDTIVLTAPGLTGVIWSNGGPVTLAGNPATVWPQQSTNYTCTGFDVNGCEASGATQVYLGQITNPTISWNPPTLTSSASSGNQWFLNGLVIPGAVNPTYVPTVTGLYGLAVTVPPGCTSDTVWRDVSVGMPDQLLGQRVMVFPNPFQDQLHVSFERGLPAVDWKLIDASGRQVSAGTAKGNEFSIPTKNISAGIYFLQLKSETEMVNLKIQKD